MTEEPTWDKYEEQRYFLVLEERAKHQRWMGWVRSFVLFVVLMLLFGAVGFVFWLIP